MPRRLRQLLIALAAVGALAGPAAAQVARPGDRDLRIPQDISSTDIQRLEQTVDEINGELTTLRRRDRASARTLQTELAELDEEVTYLKVKQRKERNVSRFELDDLRSRLEDVRDRARGDANSNVRNGNPVRTSPSQPVATEPGVIPSGTELDVRMQTGLSSATAQVEDRFQATTAIDLRQDGRVIIPAGSIVRGVVTGVRKAGRIERKGSLTLSFDQITINGRSYPIHGTVTQAIESGGYRDDAEKIGGGAAVGGIIGGILGGLKGAIAGVLIGGGGVVATTEGSDVELTPGTVLRVRLDSPLSVRGNFTRQ